jgi:hypothetical protein
MGRRVFAASKLCQCERAFRNPSCAREKSEITDLAFAFCSQLLDAIRKHESEMFAPDSPAFLDFLARADSTLRTVRSRPSPYPPFANHLGTLTDVWPASGCELLGLAASPRSMRGGGLIVISDACMHATWLITCTTNGSSRAQAKESMHITSEAEVVTGSDVRRIITELRVRGQVRFSTLQCTFTRPFLI